MTYQEAEEILNSHLPQFRSESFFSLAGQTARFLAFIIAPASADRNMKQFIYDECLKNGRDNKNLLLELGLWGQNQNLFLIYQQAGKELIISFDSYLSARNSAS